MYEDEDECCCCYLIDVVLNWDVEVYIFLCLDLGFFEFDYVGIESDVLGCYDEIVEE